MRKRLYSFLISGLHVIALVFSFLLLVSNAFHHAAVSYDDYELVSIIPYFRRGLPMLIAAGFCFLLIRLFSAQLKRIDQRAAFAAFSVVYLLLASYLILNTTDYIRADAASVFRAALEVKSGDYSSFAKGGYLYTYPHQLGLLVFDLLLSLIAETPAVIFCVNFALVLGINYVTWQISRELFSDKLVQLLTIVFSFLFFPQLFMIMFAYGQIPGLFFLLLAFFFTLRFCRINRFGYAAALLICITLSVLLRKNNLIGGIAILLYLLLHFIQTGRARSVIAGIAVVICLFLPGKALQTTFEHLSATKLDHASPSVLWVAMGTDIDNRTRGAGWYDHSSALIYQKANFNAQQAASIGSSKLRANMHKMVRNPEKASEFFRDKFLSTWCEPLYQSLWSGPIQMREQPETLTPFLTELYSDSHTEYLAETTAHLLSLIIYTGAFWYLLSAKKAEHGWALSFLYLIGGILFHLFWETKSQYVYPYVFCLLPFAACGICKTRTPGAVFGLTTPDTQ